MPRAVVLSSGDESADGAPRDHRLSQGQSSSSSSSGSGSGSDDDESRDEDRSGFLDIEAEESDDDAGRDSSPDETQGGPPSSLRRFSQFMQLPPELRSRVWELFCPDLVTKARFLHFDLGPASAAAVMRSSTTDLWTARDKVFLADQTEALRSLMAVHRESREKGLQVYPHTLAIDIGDGHCDGIVRFRRQLDVVFVEGIEHARPGTLCNQLGFAENIANLAVLSWVSPSDQRAAARVRAALRLFPSLQRLYVWHNDYELRKRHLRWAVSDRVNQYLMQTFEKEPGLGEDTQTMACWPDVHRHPDFAKFQVPPILVSGMPEGLDGLLQERGVHLWPIVTFELGSGMTRYEKLLQLKDLPYHDENRDSSDESSGSSASSPDTYQDEYESEGIDDNDIIQDDGSSEDDLMPQELSDGILSMGGRFSSPEPDTEDEDANGPAEPGPQTRAPKRRIVTDSDDDSPSSNEPKAKRARLSRPVVSESDDEPNQLLDQQQTRTADILDPESADNSGGVEVHSEDGDSDSDPPQQRRSLAERLQAHRDAHPILSSEESSVEGHDEEDDDDENDDDDDLTDEDGGGLLDRMAAESEEDDESEEEW